MKQKASIISRRRKTLFTGMVGTLLAASTMLFVMTPSYAEKIYRWKDAQGTWHFTKMPPHGQQAEAVKIKTFKAADKGNTTVSAPGENGNSDGANKQPAPNTEADNGKPEKKSAEVQKVDKKLARENCRKAKENITNLSKGSRQRIRDKKTGEVRYITEKERSEWLKNSRKTAKENCGK